jgi:purine-binding chemotaxis protein CheW
MNTMLATPSDTGSRKLDRRAGKYLTFALGKEAFAIQVSRVREIMGIQEITAVPETPAYVKGVLNLRDKVVPVVDLRLKFDMRELDYTERTCIIVAQIESPRGKLMIGVIVDGVSEVLTLGTDDIEDTPDFGSGVETPYILGMATIKNKVRILLDINMVFTAREVERLMDVTV